jgi:hypothetical protein
METVPVYFAKEYHRGTLAFSVLWYLEGVVVGLETKEKNCEKRCSDKKVFFPSFYRAL